MTRKAYIDCPLEAALAAKNHGFKFLYGVGTGEPDQIATSECFATHYIDESDIYYWIHPESLPLIEPIVGDDVLLIGGYTILRIRSIMTGGGQNDYDLFNGYCNRFVPCDYLESIIQRNGKHFPTIQYEESE